MKRMFFVTGLSAFIFLIAVNSVNISYILNIILITAAVALISAAVRVFVGCCHRVKFLDLSELKSFLEISVAVSLSVCICGTVYLHKLNNYNDVVAVYDGQTVKCTLQIITEERFTESGFGYFEAVPVSGIDTNGYSIKVYGYGFPKADVYDFISGDFLFTANESDFYLQNRADGIVLTTFIDDTSEVEPQEKPIGFIFIRLKRYVENTVTRYLGKASSFAKALILGDRTDMSSESFDSLRKSGLLHVTAVSGLHVGLAAAFAMCVFSSVRSVYLRYFCVFTVMFLLAGITGFSPSVIRSVFMISAGYMGTILLRKTDSLNALGLILTVYLFVSPFSVYSASLLLSFGASLGLILFSGDLQKAFTTWIFKLRGKYLNRFESGLISILSVSISSTVLTIPLSLFLFESVSVAGVLSNLLCLWLIKYIFILSIIVAVLGWIPFLSPLFSLISLLVNWGVMYIMKVSDVFAATVFSELSATPVTVILSALGGYLVYIILGIKAKSDGGKKRRHVVRVAASVVMAVILFVAMALSSNIYRNSDNLLHIVFEDVGQGLGSYISYNEKAVVFDCGGSKDAGETVKESLREHGIHSIEKIVVSHCHDDHINGIEDILSEWDVAEIVIPYTENNDENYLKIKALAEDYGALLVEISEDLSFSFGAVTVDLLSKHSDPSSSDMNDTCIVSLIRYGDFKALLTGDITADCERRLIDHYGLDIDVSLMSVPHHGSISSSCAEFIGVVSPELSVISVGKNSYGEPDSSVISRLLEYGEVYSTLIVGTVEVTTDGTTVEVVE